MRFFKVNPRTENFSNIKKLLVLIEKVIKNLVYFLIVFINFFSFKKKKLILDLGIYQDTRFINYLFYSIKSKFFFSYDLDLKIISLIKKVGVINFLLHCIPNFRIKNFEKYKFFLKDKKEFNKTAVNIRTKSMIFNTDFFSHIENNNTKEEKVFMPYYLYPRLYNSKIYKELDVLRGMSKIFKIVFSGSTHPALYSNFEWYHTDGKKMLNRNQIIDFVSKEFSSEIFYLTSYKDIDSAAKSSKKIIFSLNDTLAKKTSSKLSNIEHLKLIAQSSFFLTAPGTGMPMCHHIIEAIKFVTIPITSYSNLLNPKLDSNLCLNFQSFADLYSVIKKAIFMKDDEKEFKKNNLINFYNESLSPESFYKKLSDVNFAKEIIACNDHNSASLYLEKKMNI